MGVAVLQAAGIAIGQRGLLARALAAAALAICGLLLLVVAPFMVLAASSGAGSGPASSPSGIPPAFVPIYGESADAFGLNWLVLAAVHEQETGFSTHPTTYHGVNFAGCCAGPFQFNITNGPPSTWDTHKDAYQQGERPAEYPHPQRPHPSVYDDFDAAMAAGSLLRANGADNQLGQPTWNAVRAYNGAGPVAVAYANTVLGHARAWADAAERSDRVGASGPGSSGGALAWPVRGPVSSPFCERRAWETCHPGIDIAVASGTAILAAGDGRVTLTQPTGVSGGYGNYTCLQHTASVATCYAHQARILVHPGQDVTRGEQIGISDCTGRCYGPHLHFEVRADGQPVCPAHYLAAPVTGMCAPGSAGS